MSLAVTFYGVDEIKCHNNSGATLPDFATQGGGGGEVELQMCCCNGVDVYRRRNKG